MRIKNKEKRDEIFEFLKLNVPNSTNHVDEYSKLRAGKKPLVAIGVFLPLFLWAYYVADEIEKGYKYEVAGSYRSIAGIVLGLASLGKKNVLLIFGSIFLIAFLGFIQKTKNPKIINKIKITRAT
ncbi:MAG TPA: hypothetical protein VFR70_08945, partial [Flavobacterium sp.]|nr:hypothetical protein [Flavobacterium sp.]